MDVNVNNCMELMGNLTTENEAQAMVDILKAKGITDLDEISDRDWFRDLIPQALERAIENY